MDLGYKYLDDKIIKFYFDNLHDNNLSYWSKKIKKNNSIKSLERLRKKFDKNLQSLPDLLQIGTYSASKIYNIRNRAGSPKIQNGDRDIISISVEKITLIIELIDLHIDELKELELKLFEKFGRWDDVVNPKYFILHEDYLPCVVLAFQNIKRKYRYKYSELYDIFTNILYKYDNEPYSYYGIRNAHQRRTNNNIQCIEKRDISIDESTEFLDYLLNLIK